MAEEAKVAEMVGAMAGVEMVAEVMVEGVMEEAVTAAAVMEAGGVGAARAAAATVVEVMVAAKAGGRHDMRGMKFGQYCRRPRNSLHRCSDSTHINS